MILIIDNYDSFTYNLLQYIGEVFASRGKNPKILVKRNDQISLSKIRKFSPSHIVLSPGPCTPNESGICLSLAKEFSGKISLLGICLGHQAIAQAHGGKIIRAKEVVHGKTTRVEYRDCLLFDGVEQNFQAARYHSLTVERDSLPASFEVIASSEDGEIMGLAYREFSNTYGLQFHPESILTPAGKTILANFFFNCID